MWLVLSGITWGRRKVERGVEGLHHRSTLAPPLPNDVVVDVSVGPGGELVVLWATEEVRDALMSGEVPQRTGSRHGDRPRGVAVRVSTHHRDGHVEVVALDDVALSFPIPQTLPGGRLLLVGASCQWTPDGTERNAAVYDGRGRLLTEATFGNGAQHVLSTSAGEVWVGYAEEGTADNLGWGGESGPAPIGAPGIVRFGPGNGEVWRYVPLEGVPPVRDCYALNVTDTEVWAYYDAGFPIVRLGPGGARAWRSRVKGATAMVVAGATVGLAGGYDHEYDRFVVGTLDDRAFVPHGELVMRLPGGEPLPPDPVLVGRGRTLHVITATDWYTADLVEGE
jgi:hypothetical protein